MSSTSYLNFEQLTSSLKMTAMHLVSVLGSNLLQVTKLLVTSYIF